MIGSLENAGRVLREHAGKKTLLTVHVNPDGDALGSLAAMGRIAESLGCEVRVCMASRVPDYLDWLPLPWPIYRDPSELGDWTPDLLIVLDCGDAARPGPDIQALIASGRPGMTTLNIDHHLGNPAFAMHNWVESNRSATAEMVGLLAEHLGLSLAGELGRAVYLGITSDTGNFSFSNTSPDVFTLAARITQAGLRVGDFTQAAENTWSLERMHLWGKLFAEVSLHHNGRTALVVVPQKLLDKFGVRRSALEGFAAWLRRIRGVRVGVFVREDGPGRSKVSLRSMGDVDVRIVAASFGGGGHKAAAGTEVGLPPRETADAVLRAIENLGVFDS